MNIKLYNEDDDYDDDDKHEIRWLILVYREI